RCPATRPAGSSTGAALPRAPRRVWRHWEAASAAMARSPYLSAKPHRTRTRLPGSTPKPASDEFSWNQLLQHRFDLFAGGVSRAPVADHIIGDCDLPLLGPLRLKALQRAFAARAGALAEPSDPLFLGRNHHHQLIESSVCACLEQQRRLHRSCARSRGLKPPQLGLLGPDCPRMQDAIQRRQLGLRARGKHHGGQFLGSDCDAVLAQDFVAKLGQHRRPGFALQNLLCPRVGVNHRHATGAQHLRYRAFAARQPARQSDPCHFGSRRRCAAARVFFINIAMVSGPTPPGTGVKALASAHAARGSTSPTSVLPRLANSSRRFSFPGKNLSTSSACVMRFTPTSTTTAPRRRWRSFSMPGLPIAANSSSARWQTCSRLRVRECAMVTVACWCSSSRAKGLPTMSLRPTTTASRPAISIWLRSSSSMIPAGVHGRGPGRCETRLPRFTGWNPSTSFSGATASSTLAVSTCFGKGSCTKIPSISSRALSAATCASISAVVTVSGGSTCSE